jgi:hypothetical protein
MKTPALPKTSGRRLTLLTAVAVLNAGSAFAADFAGDAQAQARALLSGPSANSADTAYPSLPLAGAPASTPEPQEQARGLLAGKAVFWSETRKSAGNGTAPASPQDEGRAYAGPQETARRMILGKGA